MHSSLLHVGVVCAKLEKTILSKIACYVACRLQQVSPHIKKAVFNKIDKILYTFQLVVVFFPLSFSVSLSLIPMLSCPSPAGYNCQG